REAKEQGRGVGKYINSRDTPLYHKSNVVFNLHQARPQARSSKRIIIMEGPTDVMAAHQEGVSECVAVLGTALTAEHAKQIHRAVGQDGRLIMLFDGDSAGQTNSVKAVRTCMVAGVPCQAAVLPDGNDPAELLKEGVAALDVVLLKPQPDIDYVLRYLAPRPYELDSREQLSVIDKLLGVFREMKDIDLRDGFLKDSADYLNIDEQKLERRMNSPDLQPRHANTAVDVDEIEELPPLSQEQSRIFVILLTQAKLRSIAFDEFACEPHLFPMPWRRVVEVLVDNSDLERESLLNHECLQLDAELRSEVSRLIHHNQHSEIERKDLQEVMDQLKRSENERQIRQLEFKLQEAQRDGRQEDSKDLFKELLEMQQLMRGKSETE
ncbi:MAG: toprim domain-containing protein, partial [Planctomycetes bacterium]|nr:toprim domain-containing protein [Planctomycetota bacterium]